MKKVIRIVASPTYLDMFLKEQMIFLSDYYEVIGVASPGIEHARIRKCGIRTEEIHIERPIRLIQDIKSLWNLYLFFRKEKPHIVHSLTPKAGLLSMCAAWLARVPVRIHTFTGLLFPWKKGLLRVILKTTDSLTCFFATYVNPEGEGVRKQLQEAGITKKPLQLIADGHLRGILPESYVKKGTRSHCRQKLGISADAIVFVYTGRLTRDKGIADLQIAFDMLFQHKPNTHLLLLGEQEPELDPLPDSCRERIAQNPNIHEVGHVNNVPEWLEAGDIFVFPSHREGLPSALIEACAAGLPCIATDICGCQEIIPHASHGLLVPANNPDALFSAMKQLLDAPPQTLKDLGNNARTHVNDHYSAHRIRAALLSVYQQQLGTHLSQ